MFGREGYSVESEFEVSGPKVYEAGHIKSYTWYFTFNTSTRRAIIRITDKLKLLLQESGIREGFMMVSAMHITASVFINDDEEGFRSDLLKVLDTIAPYGSHPDGQPYKHNLTGEDNGDAHIRNILVGHQVILPITEGKLDLGPWQEVFYGEWDGRRPKRVIVKIIGIK